MLAHLFHLLPPNYQTPRLASDSPPPSRRPPLTRTPVQLRHLEQFLTLEGEKNDGVIIHY